MEKDRRSDPVCIDDQWFSAFAALAAARFAFAFAFISSAWA
jgi:hypothetical protein